MRKKDISRFDFSVLLSHTEAAKKAGMSQQLFRHYVITERAPDPFTTIAGVKYYHKDDIMSWVPEKIGEGRPRK